MNITTAKAYRSNFAGWSMLFRNQKTLKTSLFMTIGAYFAGQVHCIKDIVLLDDTCGNIGFLDGHGQ